MVEIHNIRKLATTSSAVSSVFSNGDNVIDILYAYLKFHLVIE